MFKNGIFYNPHNSHKKKSRRHKKSTTRKSPLRFNIAQLLHKKGIASEETCRRILKTLERVGLTYVHSGNYCFAGEEKLFKIVAEKKLFDTHKKLDILNEKDYEDLSRRERGLFDNYEKKISYLEFYLSNSIKDRKNLLPGEFESTEKRIESRKKRLSRVCDLLESYQSRNIIDLFTTKSSKNIKEVNSLDNFKNKDIEIIEDLSRRENTRKELESILNDDNDDILFNKDFDIIFKALVLQKEYLDKIYVHFERFLKNDDLENFYSDLINYNNILIGINRDFYNFNNKKDKIYLEKDIFDRFNSIYSHFLPFYKNLDYFIFKTERFNKNFGGLFNTIRLLYTNFEKFYINQGLKPFIADDSFLLKMNDLSEKALLKEKSILEVTIKRLSSKKNLNISRKFARSKNTGIRYSTLVLGSNYKETAKILEAKIVISYVRKKTYWNNRSIENKNAKWLLTSNEEINRKMLNYTSLSNAKIAQLLGKEYSSYGFKMKKLLEKHHILHFRRRVKLAFTDVSYDSYCLLRTEDKKLKFIRSKDSDRGNVYIELSSEVRLGQEEYSIQNDDPRLDKTYLLKDVYYQAKKGIGQFDYNKKEKVSYKVKVE